MRVIAPDGTSTRYEYDADGRMCAWYDAAGICQVQNTYDAEGRVVHQLDANGGEYSLAYADDHTTTTDADGHVSEIWYDERYRTTKTVDANGAVISYEYDEKDNITAITDALGNVTRYEYDAAGHKTKETAPDGSSYSLQYDNKGNLIRLTNWLGGVTRYEYDEHNRCVKQVNPDGGVQRWSYTEAGQVETVTDPLGAVTRYEYDGVDLVKTIDPLGNETGYRYDEQHRLTATTDALGNTTAFVYDDADNIVSVTFADGTSFAYEYDAVGNMTAETDAEGNTTRYEYDALRQRVKTIYPDGSESESRYDNSGNMISATDAAGGEASAAYDGRGHLTATTDELGNQTAYEYDLNGNLIAQTLATGDEIRYTYDVRGRLQTMEAAGESIRYEYDAAGNVTRTVAGDVETRRRYDSMSRIVYELDENGENAQYRYDLAGNAVWIKNSYGETVNEFDANGNLVTVKDARTGAVKFRYERDAAGNKTAVYLADGSMIRYDYDELGAYLGYEFVEPGRQPHGTVPGANYKPSPLVPPAEETKNWKKTDALKEADKQIRHAKFAEYTTEVAYVEAEAMAPGSAQAKSAKAAYAQTKKAVDAANAAKDAVADAKTQTGINRAVTSAQIAAGTAGRAADMVCLWEGSVASAKQTQQAEEELKKAIMTLAAKVGSVEEENICSKNETGSFFKTVINVLDDFFGASSETRSVIEYEQILADAAVIKISQGIRKTRILSHHGDSSKFISVYAVGDKLYPEKSSYVGVVVNIFDLSVFADVGLDNMGVGSSFKSGDISSAFVIKADISNLELGIESSITEKLDEKNEVTTYAEANASAWIAFAVYYFVKTGQWISTPGGSPLPAFG